MANRGHTVHDPTDSGRMDFLHFFPVGGSSSHRREACEVDPRSGDLECSIFDIFTIAPFYIALVYVLRPNLMNSDSFILYNE